MSVISAQMASRFASFRSPEEDADEKGITIRPSSTAIFAVDSFDRYPSFQASIGGRISPYSFSINRNQSLINGFFKRIAVTEIVLPYYIPNINLKTNRLSVSRNGGAFVTVDINTLGGFMSPNDIAEALQVVLIAAGFVGLTVQYTPDGRFLFQTGGVDTIAFQRASFAGGASLNEFQLYDLLNLGAALPNPVLPGQVVLTGVTRCRYTEYVDIVCSQLTYNQELKDGSSDPVVRDMLARVYIEAEDGAIQPYYRTNSYTAVPPGTISGAEIISNQAIPGTYPFTIHRQFTQPKQIKWENTQPLGNITFELFDDRGNLLSANLSPLIAPDSSLPDWRMTLLCSEN
jgi:hypothetical protein